MKKSFFVPLILSSLILSGCMLIPDKTDTSKSTSTDTTSSTDTGTPEPDAKVESVHINRKSIHVKPGATFKLDAESIGSNIVDDGVNWSSDNSKVSVNDGVLSVANDAQVNTTANITATSKADPTKSVSCTVNISNVDTYTILVYMCGSNLESQMADDEGIGLASSDLKEMVTTLNKPANVDIVIETGGATLWNGPYTISSSKLQRHHVENNKLVTDYSLSYASMGATSTLQSFIEYGLTDYKSDYTSLIMWNHGGAVSGCCIDEKKDDGILAKEMDAALKGAFQSVGRTEKLEWVGYDCCVMAYADLAAINAQYFKYMVSSQELENGTGWAYKQWLPTLYQNVNVSTETLLSKICSSFIEDNGGNSSRNDQTLSVIDLEKFADFADDFDAFAGTLKSSDWSKLSTCFTKSVRFGSGYDQGYYDYGLSDFKGFLEYADTNYETTALITSLSDSIVYSAYASKYYTSGTPCGVCVFMTPSSLRGIQIAKSDYTSADTKLPNWREFVINNGTFYSSYYY